MLGITALAAVWFLGRASLETAPIRDAAPGQARSPSGSRATAPSEPLLADDRSGEKIPARLSLEGAQFTARVVGSDGAAIVGARLSWTPLLADVVALRAPWDAVDRNALAEATIWAESGSDGTFAFEQTPGAHSSHGSVIWITHREHAARAVLLPVGATPSGPIVLESATPRSAKVVDRSGTSLAGATVRQCAVTEPDAAEGPETWARRAFQREGTTSSDGTVPLATFSGREALVARRSTLTSVPAVRACTGDVVLVLSPSFTAEGLVLLETGSLERGATRVSVSSESEGKERTELAAATVSVDGTWGPLTLPLLDTEGYRFTLEGGNVIRQDRELAPPLEGETVRVDFDAALGVDQFFICLDEATGDVLMDALVKVHWLESDESWTTIEARPDENGYVLVHGCRPGAIHFDARAPGYAFQRGGPRVVPEAEATTWEIELVRAGQVAGRCVFAGEPVAAFTVGHWPGGEVTQIRKEVVEASEDGSFVLDDVGEGELSLVAHSEGHGQSEVQRVAITAGETTEVTLALTESARGRGQVVDQLTRQPVPGATIQLFATSGSQPVQPTGPPVLSDGEGRFELEGLSAVATTFWTRAEGYSGSYTTVRGRPGQTVDLGLVALARTQPLQLRLDHGPDQDPTRYSVGTRLYGLPKTAFSADGVVRVDAFPAGYYEFVVDLPDRSTFGVPVELMPGRDWVVELPVAGSARLQLEVAPAEGRDLPPEVWVFVKYPAERAGMDRIARLPPSGRIALEHLLPGPCYVQLEVGDLLVASEPYVVEPDTAHSLRLSLDAPIRRFRVVDTHGTPLPSTTIAFVIDGDDKAEIGGTTNADGELRCGAVAGGDVVAHLKNATLGVAAGVPVDLSSDPSEVVELTFEVDASWTAVLRDGDEPLSGVACNLFPHGAKMIITHEKTTDAEGGVAWDGLGEGIYDLVARHPDCWPVEVALETNQGAPHVVQMRRLGDLLFHVRGPDGSRIPEAQVELASVAFEQDVAAWIQLGLVSASPDHLRTDGSGEVRLDRLPHGAYRWRVVVPGNEILQGVALVVAGELATVEVIRP